MVVLLGSTDIGLNYKPYLREMIEGTSKLLKYWYSATFDSLLFQRMVATETLFADF